MTQHPVDSTYHHCCNGIGRHTPDCNPDLPIPAGAKAGDWDSIDLDGVLTRSLEWGRFDTVKVGVSIDGFQNARGEVSRSIALYDSVGRELTADDARALAAKLVEAAEAMEQLQ